MNLFIIIKQIYFDHIYLGSKTKEFRALTKYWTDRLKRHQYDTITFQAGYKKNSPRLTVKFIGYDIETITHEHFGNVPTEVYAIGIGDFISFENVNSRLIVQASIKAILDINFKESFAGIVDNKVLDLYSDAGKDEFKKRAKEAMEKTVFRFPMIESIRFPFFIDPILLDNNNKPIKDKKTDK